METDRRAVTIFQQRTFLFYYFPLILQPPRALVLHFLPQEQHDELEAKFLEERAALEAKYQKLYQPLYTKRCEIVNGVQEVEGAANETTPGAENNEKGVPAFWLTAMKNNEVLAEEISEHDEAALKYLKDIKWSRIENPKGFKLEFFFDTNPYFTNFGSMMGRMWIWNSKWVLC